MLQRHFGQRQSIDGLINARPTFQRTSASDIDNTVFLLLLFHYEILSMGLTHLLEISVAFSSVEELRRTWTDCCVVRHFFDQELRHETAVPPAAQGSSGQYWQLFSLSASPSAVHITVSGDVFDTELTI